MSSQTRVVETESGKEVRRPYREACRDYVLGWMLAFAVVAMFFLSIATHGSAPPELAKTGAIFTWVFWTGVVMLYAVRAYRPVRFYELVEEPRISTDTEVSE